MKYRIKFFSDFLSSIELKKLYEKLYDTSNMSNYGIDKDIYITSNDDYTHAIIFNLATPVLRKDIKKIKCIRISSRTTYIYNTNSE